MTATTSPQVETTGEVIAALAELVRTTRSIARQRQDAMGASGTPLAILKALSHGNGHARPGDLAVATGVAPSVVSRALARLEHDGLVVRTPDLSDARACNIALTAAGREHLAAVHREYSEVLGDSLADLDPADLERLPSLLRALERALQHAAARHFSGSVAGHHHVTPAPTTESPA